MIRKSKSINFIFSIAASLTLLFFSTPAQSKIGRFESHFVLSTQYSVFKDLQLSDGEATDLTSSLDLEASFKVFRSFYLSAVATKSTDESRQGYGLGARIDLPGFFFFGASRGAFRARAKQYPFNTSAYIQSVLIENAQENGNIRRSIASRYGFTLEIFLFNDITYLQIDGSLFSLEGNSFLTYGAGLGFEF